MPVVNIGHNCKYGTLTIIYFYHILCNMLELRQLRLRDVSRGFLNYYDIDL